MINFEKKDIIPFINFIMTDKCNYRCDYCIQEARVEREKKHSDIHASDEVINNFMNIVKNLKGQWKIRLIGGEVLTHPRIFELLEFIVSAGHNIHLTTNFSFPITTYKKIVDICGDRLVALYPSFHATQVASLNIFLNKAIEFNNYRSKTTEFVVLSALTEENFKILRNLKEELLKYDIEFNFQRLIINGEFIKYNQEIEDYLEQCPENSAKIEGLLKGKNTFGMICNAGYKSFNIQPNGYVSRCYTEQGPLNYIGELNQKNFNFKLLQQPMPCLYNKCKCCDVILNNNLIDLEHKNYLQAYSLVCIYALKKWITSFKKKLHSLKII